MGGEKLVPVSQIADLVLGGTPKRDNPCYWGGQIKWASAKDVVNTNSRYIFNTEETITELGLNESNTKLLPKDTIVITARGTVGAMVMLGEPMCFNQTCYGITAKEGVDRTYLYFALKASIDNINSVSYGTVFNTITMKSFDSIKVPLPSIDEQKRIADILGKLDDKIELNRQMNRTLEAMARAIFKSWFVDFDPVYSKMEGRDYPLPAEVMDLFPDELIESELGLIPKGWVVGSVTEKIGIHNGYAFKSEDYSEEGIFVFRTKNFTNSNSVERLPDDVFLPESFLESHKKFICQPYDSHVVMVGASVGKTSIIYPNCLPALRNQNMWCLRPKKNFPYRHYTNCLMADLIKSKLTWASGSARSFFRKSDFYSFDVIFPEKRILMQFEQNISPFYVKIANNLSETDTLRLIRDLLLSKLMSGEIEV